MAGLSFFEYPDIHDVGKEGGKEERDTVLPEEQRLLQRRSSIATSLNKRLLSFSVGGGRVSSIRRLVFNVNGTRFVAWEDQFDRFPHTLLGSDSLRRVFYDADTKEYKFDRCPKVFKHILMYYRTGVLHLSSDVCLSTFIEDLEFFRISLDESLGTCCYETYQSIREEFLGKDPLGEVNPDRTRSQSPTTLRQKMWQVFHDVPGSAYGSAFNMVVGYFIAITVISNIVETVSCGDRYCDTCDKLYPWVFECIDTACVSIFTLEFFMMLFAAPNRWNFLKSFVTLIDVVAILPFYLNFLVRSDGFSSTVLRSLRAFRILRFGSSSRGLRMLVMTLKECMSQLAVLFFAMFIFGIICSTLIFYAESPENMTFSSIPATFWYVIVTMASVGYGDMLPKSTVGMTLGAVCSVFGVVLLTIPLTIVGTTFSRMYKKIKIAQVKTTERRENQTGREMLPWTQNDRTVQLTER
ncbi:PREDICTED: potassium voltage-gated channel protein Shal-like [Branchiostoma belcheri]|uniref:Potassium voltage-gated channel protein Shal-like n=1 Tax=Branchiostoma belcheri TaxID=7741 RepID=A0A6P4ZB85_BRABE|nr:PREDICTED: potassium voltage-gated channel protein Shal-like [Branchiostoma belcheri]